MQNVYFPQGAIYTNYGSGGTCNILAILQVTSKCHDFQKHWAREYFWDVPPKYKLLLKTNINTHESIYKYKEFKKTKWTFKSCNQLNFLHHF